MHVIAPINHSVIIFNVVLLYGHESVKDVLLNAYSLLILNHFQLIYDMKDHKFPKSSFLVYLPSLCFQMFSSFNWYSVKCVRLSVPKWTPLFPMFSSVKADVFTVLHAVWLLGQDSTQSSSTVLASGENLVCSSPTSLYTQVKSDSIILSGCISLLKLSTLFQSS